MIQASISSLKSDQIRLSTGNCDIGTHMKSFPKAPYDGMLVSKSVVDGDSGGSGRYSQGNRRRVLFRGIRDFLRLENHDIKIMGDNGAFTYVNEEGTTRHRR